MAGKAGKELGALVRRHRKESGFTGPQLAALIGISDSFLSRVESGGRNLSRENLARLAHALRLPEPERAQLAALRDEASGDGERPDLFDALARFEQTLATTQSKQEILEAKLDELTELLLRAAGRA